MNVEKEGCTNPGGDRNPVTDHRSALCWILNLLKEAVIVMEEDDVIIRESLSNRMAAGFHCIPSPIWAFALSLATLVPPPKNSYRVIGQFP
jgi:hypothetical protein